MKKIISLVLVLVLALTAIGGTLAYFTDITEEQVNVFTVGGVDIELDEPKWDPEEAHVLVPGATFDKDPTITVQENSRDAYVFLEMELNKYVSLINLMGVDAYINGVGGLEGTYPGFTAFMGALTDDVALRTAVLGRWFGGIEHAKWEIMNQEEIANLVAAVANKQNPTQLRVVLGYKDIMSAEDKATFMTSFTMPSTVTEAMMTGSDAYKIDGVSKSNFNTDASDFRITFTASAIQSENIDGLQAAYTALLAEKVESVG